MVGTEPIGRQLWEMGRSKLGKKSCGRIAVHLHGRELKKPSKASGTGVQDVNLANENRIAIKERLNRKNGFAFIEVRLCQPRIFFRANKLKQPCFIYAPTEVSIEFSDGKHRQAVSPGLKKARAS